MAEVDKPSILVVEDEQMTASILKNSLEDLGYRVKGIASSGEDAIQKAGSLQPDLILMDILLGSDTDGVAAAEQIRAKFNIPIVYVSTYADENTLERAKQSQPFGYLVKPLEQRELHATIEVALHRHKLESLEKKALHILHSISAGVLTVDNMGNVIFLNQPAERLTGWKQEEAVGVTLSEVFKVTKQAEDSLTRAGSGTPNKLFRERTSLISKDGRVIPIDYSATSMRSAEPASEGYVITFYDVSERKRIERALDESRNRYKDLVNSIEGIVWEGDGRTHHFSFVSRRAEKLLGYALERWYERPDFWKEVLHPEDREEAIAFYSRALAEKQDHQYEYRMITADSRIIWIRDSVSVIAEEGRSLKLRGVMVDISELKKAEDHLRYLEKAIETAQIGVTISDMNRRILYVNPADAATHGYSVDELIGKDVRMFSKPVQWKAVTSEGMKQMRSWRREGINVRKDGSEFPVQLMSDVVINQAGEPIGIVTTCEDITVRKTMESELQRAHEELERKVQERTSALSKVIEDLREQIAYRRQAEEALDESEHKYRTLIRSMSEGILQVDMDDVIQYVNSYLCNMLGYLREEMLGKRATEFIVYEEDHHVMLKKNQLRTMNIADQYEIRLKKKNGEILWTHVSGGPVIDAKGTNTGSIGIITDISQRKEAEAAMRESEERYALAAKGANDGLWDWNLRTNRVYYSPRWKSMSGRAENEIDATAEAWLALVHTDDLPQLQAQLSAHLEGLTPHFESEHRMLHKDGTFRWMLTRGLAVRDALGKAYRLAGSQTDITERKEAVEQLLHDAFHDRLTGLSNRALFIDRLSGAMLRAKRRDKYLFAVLCLDLDRFKIVNESLTHTIGDQLLASISRRLESCLRPGDTVARLGGDEFAILLDDIADPTDAVVITDRIQSELQNPFILSGHDIFTSASMGIALSTTGYERPEDLLRDADTAMYRAKSRGKARHEIFDKTMHVRAVDQLRLETDLRRAVERKEFLLHYQPIVSLKTGKITGFEALLRWQQPHRGLIMPGEIIPMAEETGLIIPIGQWVIEEACKQLQLWQKMYRSDPPLTISINLSGKQFSQTDLIDHLKRVLEETGLDPASLKLEITESVVMENAEFAIPMLLQLKQLNLKLEIDDFGTGYSSLSYLHRFPIDTLKIDQSFVSRITPSGENLEIIRTIVSLGRSLNMSVIAEGVEKPEQRDHLAALGCHYAQGYLFSKPVDVDQATKLVLAG